MIIRTDSKCEHDEPLLEGVCVFAIGKSVYDELSPSYNKYPVFNCGLYKKYSFFRCPCYIIKGE